MPGPLGKSFDAKYPSRRKSQINKAVADATRPGTITSSPGPAYRADKVRSGKPDNRPRGKAQTSSFAPRKTKQRVFGTPIRND